MGGEKFHITVTIDIAKSLADRELLEFSLRIFCPPGTIQSSSVRMKKTGCQRPRDGISACNFTVMFSL
jgi:hypothetical protein